MDDSTAKTLPHNPEAERAILGAAILDPDSLLEVIPLLDPHDFFLPQHKIIYCAMQVLVAGNQGINTVNLMEILSRGDQLEAAGGLAYLSQLADGLPRVTDVRSYAEIVNSKATQRELIHFGEELQKRAWEGKDEDSTIIDKGIADLLQIASRQESASQPRPFKEVGRSAVDELVSAKLDPGKAGRMKFGIPGVDKLIGGVRRKEVCIIVAPTSNGKSLLAFQLAAQSGRDGFKVLYFSAEMPAEQIVLRELAYRADVEFFHAQRPEKLSVDDLSRLSDAALEPLPIQIVDRDITPTRIWAVSEAAKRTNGLDLVIVDYDQLVIEAGIDLSSADDNVFRHQRSFMLGAKRLAERLDVCVLLLCQPRKVPAKVSEGVAPRLDDIWGDSSVRNTPHVILWLVREFFRHDMDIEYERKATLYILKSRNGPTGLVEFEFDPDRVHFGDLPAAEEVHVP